MCGNETYRSFHRCRFQSNGNIESMQIGYLHVGNEAHGVVRYGRLLEEAARRHLDDQVISRHVELGAQGESALTEAVHDLSAADVVHVQYNPRIWGEPYRAPWTVYRFARQASMPWIVTLHDVRDGYGPSAIVRRLWAERAAGRTSPSSTSPSMTSPSMTSPSRASHAASPETREPTGSATSSVDAVVATPAGIARSAWKAGRFLVQEAGNALATLIATRGADRVLVCTHEEARRAEPIAGDTPVSVVPHFVEERPHRPDRAEARRELGLDGHRVVGVLGYIHRRKGHDLLVEALPHLPGDVVAVFVGRPGRDSPGFAEHLRERARALGVDDRVRITGYVDEPTLDRYLVATDLALCPFREASASGSLSTWIASETPILASDLPLFDEYESIVPGSVAVAPSLAPEPLARAVERALDRPPSAVRPRLRELRKTLTLDRVIHEHRHVYRLAVRANLTAKDA